jgi:hypothetical protein
MFTIGRLVFSGDVARWKIAVYETLSPNATK